MIQDFLKYDEKITCDVVMNPPYKNGKEHVEHALKLAADGVKVCAFLKVQFLEGKARAELYKKYKPCRIYVCSTRRCCAKNGDFYPWIPKSMLYCWFVWEKGNHDNPPQLFWI